MSDKNMEQALQDARDLLAELEGFYANNAGERAIKILRSIVGKAAPITSAELIKRTGGGAGSVNTRGFPSDLREPSALAAKEAEIERLTVENERVRGMTGTETRHADRDRNVLLNRASVDLEKIITGHDPEIHNLGNRVWDRLDCLAAAIEARSAARIAILESSVRECLSWVQHWQADVAGNLKPTPDSLAMIEAKLAALSPIPDPAGGMPVEGGE